MVSAEGRRRCIAATRHEAWASREDYREQDGGADGLRAERGESGKILILPPDPAKVQAAKKAVSLYRRARTGKRARLNFRDYQKPGDSLGIQIDLANNRVWV